ncbi:PAB-dependent poly(A)-specific ribonuclease subunit PAN3 [Leucoagaricus sp. SymC.cos]|nr:PAB-dependent poly(A)-specific ribonuclease subunit PAN3 [Leucoagaricus sp. SymC.cos]
MHSISLSHQFRQLLQSQSETIHTIAPPSTTSLPDECQSHRSFVPLEQHGRTTERRKLKNWYSTVYRAIKTSDGRPIALCGVENYRLMHQSAFSAIELWSRNRLIDHLPEMIRPKIQQEMEDAMLATDRLKTELLSELENPRLIRLLCKFGFINERPEFALEPRWSETGDRYIIKLFRDYVFHQVDEYGNPAANMTHVPTCLNKLDAGSEEHVMVVSYKEIKACIEGAFSGDVYVYGGTNDPGTLSRYSTKDNAVTLLQCGGNHPGKLYTPLMTIVGSVLALHGGYKDRGEHVDRSLFLLNLVSRKWSKITAHGDAPDDLVERSMVAVDTTIYIYGISKYRYGLGVTEPDLWAFNLNTLRTKPTWELVKPCSPERPLLVRALDEKGILVPYRKGLMLIASCFGFLTKAPPPKRDLGTFVWTFDLKSKCWSTLGRIVGDSLLQSRLLAPAVVVFDDVVYAVGDYTPGLDKRIVKYSVFAFNISERRWSKLDYPLDPRPHMLSQPKICATTRGLKIFFCGGIGDDPNRPDRNGMVYVIDIKRIVHNSSIHPAEKLTEIQKTSQINLEEKFSQLERENEKLKHSQVILAELQREKEKSKHDQIILAKLKQENEELKRKQIIFAELERENDELKRGRVILEKENEELKHSLGQTILETLLAANMSTNMWEMDAQDVVDFLAEVVERQELHQSRTERRRILNLFRRIAKSAQVFPKCTELSGVQCNFTYPMNDEGGYGLIYKGTFNQQAVCVKVVRANESSMTADAKDSVRRILRAQTGELALLAHVSHLNIIPLYGAYFSAENKRICIVTPWMENGDLTEFLRKSNNTSSIQILLMSDIAAGLQYLHDMDIIHADLKAKNVLVSRSQRAILADFGVSTILSTNVGATTARDFAGTNHWMAPELLLGEGPLPPTPQSDMWGFGCICFEVSADQIPFNGYQSGQVIAALILNPKATPLRPRKNGDPIVADGGPLLTLAEECWNRDPSQRPTAAKALQFLSDLNVKDERPSMEEELAMFEAAKSGRPEVKIDYGRILSIIHKVGLNCFGIRIGMTEQ